MRGKADAQELFTVTGEECAELIVAMSKISRFGYDRDKTDNLRQELGDIFAMIELFVEHQLITEEQLVEAAANKLRKLQTYSNLIPADFFERREQRGFST